MKIREWFRPKKSSEASPKRREGFEMRDIKESDLPDVVEEEFDDAASREYPAFYPRFTRIGVIDNADGSKTYVADWEIEENETMNEGMGKYRVYHSYIADVVDGAFAGFADLKYRVGAENPAFPDVIVGKPYVGNVYTETPGNEVDFKRKGLGQRRYRLMNELSRRKHGLPLHSGHSTSPEAEALWEKFVTLGSAERVGSSKKADFRFKQL